MNDSRVPVVQLIDGFATEEQSGGAAQFGIQLARHLDSRIYQSYVCGLWRYDTPSERRWRRQLHAEGIQTAILVEQPRSLLTDLARAASLLQRLIERVQPKIINSHFERGDLLGLVSKIRQPSRVRIVRTMHADQQWQTRPWAGALLNLLAFPWLFDAEVAISATTQAVMDARYGARLVHRKSVLLYNGISPSLVQTLAQRSPALSAVSPCIAIIGRLETQKGHRYFLDAAAEVLKHVPDARFWIIGAGSLEDDLRRRVEQLRLNDSVEFLGQRSDIPHLLEHIDVLASASIWEGFPTVILEAMAAGVPVVATDVSGSRELVRDGITGRLVPMADPPRLAAAIVDTITDRQASLVMAGRAQTEVQRYTLAATAQGYHQLYQRLLQGQESV
jgi:glycosyltransferase involved in cell wall biosynthesis